MKVIPDDATTAEISKKSRQRRRIAFLAIWGPGLIVMLADTDIGSLVTAAQSGAELGYKMIAPSLILIPILYVVQEITIRLGIITGKGHGALIRENFGIWWGFLSAGTLFLTSVGALLTEFAGVAGVGDLFGISSKITIPVATAFLIGIALTGSYRRVERIGVALGLAELIFIPAVLLAHPHVNQIFHGFTKVPIHNHTYLLLLAANIGAVIMPWMIFYQQGAVIDKKLTVHDLKSERRDTAFGAFLTQAIAIAVVIVFAATVGMHHGSVSLSTVTSLQRGLSPYLGGMGSKIILAVALTGAALVAALVASLAGAWGLSEVMGWKHTLNEKPQRENAMFYTVYSLIHIAGALIVMANLDLVALVIHVEVMNSILLPIVLGFLLALEAKVLPEKYRMKGIYRVMAIFLSAVLVCFALYMIPSLI